MKGFGCRPVEISRRTLRAGVGKPPGKEPAVSRSGWLLIYGDLAVLGVRLGVGVGMVRSGWRGLPFCIRRFYGF